THNGYLWTSTGTQLGAVTFTGETASGWQVASFASPIAVTANTVYVVSYHAPNGHYASDRPYFNTSGLTVTPLYALSNSEAPNGNGVYAYGSAGTFPNNSYQSTNYYVDVVFTTSSGISGQSAIIDSGSSVLLAPVNTQPNLAVDQPNLIAIEGVPAANSGTFSDAESGVSLSASLGTITANSDGTWTWSWTPVDGPASTKMTITADDGQGGVTQQTFTVSVSNSAPTANFANTSGVINSNGTAVLAFSGASDLGSADAAAGFLYSYDCTGDQTFEITDTTLTQFPCPYPTEGTYNAVGRIKDKDGAFTDYTAVVNVIAVAPATPTAVPTVVPTPVPQPTYTCPCTIFDLTAPAAPVLPVVDPAQNNEVTLGVRFQSDINGYLTGLRFYKEAADTGTHIGTLWTDTGTLLGTVNFANETASGWQAARFDTPIAITANTVYVAAYYSSSGLVITEPGTLSNAGVDRAPLHIPANTVAAGNGLIAYGAPGTFPATSAEGTNFWVDVVFVDALPAPTPVPSVTVTPSPAASDVPPATSTSTAATADPAETIVPTDTLPTVESTTMAAPTDEPTLELSATFTGVPTVTLTASSTAVPTVTPSATFTSVPTVTPTATATVAPTQVPPPTQPNQNQNT
ncbi:MAG: DUF4082 domain-containing protein, partial [Anaerolineaceae bacterium]|nr:DUF4082 domain-containing protein [Anaerolineaceae bacterium]